MIRVHNEEKTLARCIFSLKKWLRIPFKVVCVLNCCTDSSEQIAQGLADEVYHYDLSLSRAGIELMATPPNHRRSFVTFTTFAWRKAVGSLNWGMKWDADFIMTHGMSEFINNYEFKEQAEPVCMAFNSRFEDGSPACREYLIAYRCPGYRLEQMWEVPIWPPHIQHALVPDDVFFVHDTPNPVRHKHQVKDYWRRKPWFMLTNQDDALRIRRRYQNILYNILRSPEEPLGLARGGNDGCGEIMASYRNMRILPMQTIAQQADITAIFVQNQTRNRAFESFSIMNTYPLRHIVFVSASMPIYGFDHVTDLVTAFELVSTRYVFYCNSDQFIFDRPGFIEECIPLLHHDRQLSTIDLTASHPKPGFTLNPGLAFTHTAKLFLPVFDSSHFEQAGYYVGTLSKTAAYYKDDLL